MSYLSSLDEIDAKYNKIQELRNKAEALVQDVLPHHWSDGDVRYISSDLYNLLNSILEEKGKLELGPAYGTVCQPVNSQLVYIGQFGTITLKPSNGGL